MWGSILVCRSREHRILGNAPPDVTPLDFCLWDCKNGDSDEMEVDKRDELLARLLDAASRINKREDRRTIRHLQTRVAKCTKLTV